MARQTDEDTIATEKLLMGPKKKGHGTMKGHTGKHQHQSGGKESKI